MGLSCRERPDRLVASMAHATKKTPLSIKAVLGTLRESEDSLNVKAPHEKATTMRAQPIDKRPPPRAGNVWLLLFVDISALLSIKQTID